MASSSELKNRRNKYYTLLDNTKNVLSYISQGYNEMENASKIGEHFSINNESADSGEIKSIRNELENTKNYLNNTIIPEINNQISTLTRKIAEAEAEAAKAGN